MCGNREMILETSQKALDLGYDGLIIESHIDPDNAWSDAAQQVTPDRLIETKNKNEKNNTYKHLLNELREHIDDVDREIIDILAKRIDLVEKIGEFKKEQELTSFQVERWNEIAKSRINWAKDKNLDETFIKDLYKLIHLASINAQNKVIHKKKNKITI